MRGNGSATIVALGLVGFVMTTNPALSQLECNPRAGYPPVLYENEHFAGLFRIALNPPDLQDRAAVQRHLVLAEIWGRVIRKEMLARTRGLCSAHFEVQGFPDSRVALVVNRTAGRIDQEKSSCTQVLEDILQHFQPTDELVKYAVEELESTRQPSDVRDGELENSVGIDALNVSNAILPLIYDKKSLLHALVSAGTISYSAVGAMELRAWIQGQRSPDRAMLEEMAHCVLPHRDPVSSDDVPDARLKSGILPPGEIHLPRSENWMLPPGPLRYAVVIGNPVKPPIGLFPPGVAKKYCWRDHTFTVEDDTQAYLLTVRPRCNSILLLDLDAWVFIYCDPKDCTSERAEKAVMTGIARDPEILDFARQSSNTTMPRGPYLIIIK